ncbi:MAG: peroxiredoxin family protein [Gemmatimonadaceae bacterium]
MMTTNMVRRAALAVGLSCSAAPIGAQAAPVRALGPADGRELPAVDTGRVRVGTVAPDFTLKSLPGPNVTLSSFRGKKSVLLQFYRGHW